MEIVFFFVFFYPLFMAIFWMMGAVLFFMRRERKEREVPELETCPQVAILIPCHNEVDSIGTTVYQLTKNRYPNFEIIVIDDGSSDGTDHVLHGLSNSIDRLRVVTLTRNYGKAMALKAGVLATQAEYLMCIDADAILDKDALFWMMQHFLSGPRVGAVTGNPRVLNRRGLLSRIQIGEFSAIIGMVKRTQRDIGRIFTVSGVNACFRRSALESVGYWSTETQTEDIDISWRLQLRHWDIRYEPRALTWILVPETLGSLWRQRLRWARGGIEAARKYTRDMWRWTSRRMWPVYLEYWLGVAWAYSFTFTVVCWAATNLLPPGQWPAALAVATLVPGWTGVVLGVTCLTQFSVGLLLDSHYERRGMLRYLFWAIWYPAIYWMISAATTVVAVPSSFRRRTSRYAVWKSPPRKHAARVTSAYGTGSSPFRQPERSTGQKWLEGMVTLVFWGAWGYLVMPLLSLILWFAGIYLFTDRMITLGGYETFTDRLAVYSGSVLVMWAVLSLWVVWNRMHYGRHDRRNRVGQVHRDRPLIPISKGQALMQQQLADHRMVAIHFDVFERPVVDPLVPVSPSTQPEPLDRAS